MLRDNRRKAFPARRGSGTHCIGRTVHCRSGERQRKLASSAAPALALVARVSAGRACTQLTATGLHARERRLHQVERTGVNVTGQERSSLQAWPQLPSVPAALAAFYLWAGVREGRQAGVHSTPCTARGAWACRTGQWQVSTVAMAHRTAMPAATQRLLRHQRAAHRRKHSCCTCLWRA